MWQRSNYFQRTCTLCLGMIVVIVVGCQTNQTAEAPNDATPTDEAKKRAIAEGVENAAAADYFSYKQPYLNDRDGDGFINQEELSSSLYQQPDQVQFMLSRYDSNGDKQLDQNETVEAKKLPYAADYFAGMDSISRFVDAQAPNAVPDQLLDVVQGQRAKTEVVALDLLNEGHSQSHNEIIGRNTWMIWCAGNEGFWDYLANDSLGFIDLVKLVDSRKRMTRFTETGMINEPGMRQSTRMGGGAESSAYTSDSESSSADMIRDPMFGLQMDEPADRRYRAWRDAYLTQTFKLLAEGKHKSQIGLSKRDTNGELKGEPLFKGEIDEHKGESYRYPSEYLKMARGAAGYATAYAPSSERSATYDESNGGETDESVYGGDDLDLYNYLDANVPPPDLYGLSSGVIGLRLFPNPYFDAEAQSKWDAARYYDPDDRAYWTDPSLVRPFRVGMSCGFCHTSFHPLRPPLDVNQPHWENLSGNIGAQYLSMRATVGGLLEPDSFVYHLLESQPRGTIDTSLIASDNINNPNTMNAVFGLPQRAILSLSNPREQVSNASSGLPSLWNNIAGQKPPLGDALHDPVPPFWLEQANQLSITDRIVESNSKNRYVPRILLDGSDGIGTWGALARVYLNIGSFWEQWNELHQVVLGFTPQEPFLLSSCEANSVYWNSTERRVAGLRDYFLLITPPMPLLSAPDGESRMKGAPPTDDAKEMERTRALSVDWKQLSEGRRVFAENCIVCHSSIQPESAIASEQSVLYAELYAAVAKEGEAESLGLELPELPIELIKRLARRRSEYRALDEAGEQWEHDPAGWLGDADYQQWARHVVERPAFWVNNYLSTDYRIPINVVGTNSARAMGTNAMNDHMWQDFASNSYRQLPPVGTIPFFNPYVGESGGMDSYMPRHRVVDAPEHGGGPGYYRVPSLISIWATAPLLHNNSLGLFNNDPSVEGRLLAFDDAIRKLLWKEKRLESSSYNGATPERLAADHGLIWRTPQETHLTIDGRRVPHLADNALGLSRLYTLPGLGWLRRVSPVWLPSLIFFLGGVLCMLLSNDKTKRAWSIALLVTAAMILALQWFVATFPDASVLAVLRNSGLRFTLIALAFVGVLLWLPIWGKTRLRTIGSVVLVATILLGCAGLIARAYPLVSFGDVIRQLKPFALVPLTLAIVAAILFAPLTPRVTRWFGYGSTLLALAVGLVLFFNAGKLGDLRIGPIPKGTPVNLLANFNSEADRALQVKSVKTVLSGLREIKSRNLDQESAQRVMRETIAPALMDVNKCPDFVMDSGHYYPWFENMSDADKNALIELLKTF